MTSTATIPVITSRDSEPAGLHRSSAQTGSTALAELKNLNVWFTDSTGGAQHVVRDVSLEIHPGECVAVIGESGSGKSVTARSLIGLTGENAHVQADHATIGPHSVQTVTERQWRRIRGRQVGFILQDALVSLDPLRTVGAEISESLRLHGVSDAGRRRRRVVELLDSVGVPEPAIRAQQRPAELSGGLRQRALIASAIANDPPLLVADEPTTALDVTVQAQVLDLLAERRAAGTALLLISHDFSVVGRLADRVLVMQGGEIVEAGTAQQVLSAPRHEYTRELLDAVPSGSTKGDYLTLAARTRAVERADAQHRVRRQNGAGQQHGRGRQHSGDGQHTGGGQVVLDAGGLTKSFRGPDGVDRTAVNNVSFQVRTGQTLGIVGESGSGKSTAAAIASGLTAADAGTVRLKGQPWSQLSTTGRRRRRREMTVVYQDPLSSFDRRWNAERILLDALQPPALDRQDAPGSPQATGGMFSLRRRREHRERLRDRAAELARLVGLEPRHLGKHPLKLSGGQRQRLAIARALAPQPDVVVLDEAVSALDVSVQAQVLDLLTELQETLGTTYVFISHDLGVIHHMSDHILVMKAGAAVEYGDGDQVFNSPQHRYTQALLASLDSLQVHSASAAMRSLDRIPLSREPEMSRAIGRGGPHERLRSHQATGDTV